MPSLADILLTPGAPIVLIATVVSGIGAGFAGFGAALVFVPLAMMYLEPLHAVTLFSIVALSTLASLFPRDIRLADHRALATFVGGALLGLPLGVLILASFSALPLRIAACAACLATVTALFMGLRYQVADTQRNRATLGLLTGASAGAIGLVSPVLALVRLRGAGERASARAAIRAALPLVNLAFFALITALGLVPPAIIGLGAAMLPVFALATFAGRELHARSRRFWEAMALVATALAAMVALPAIA